MGVLLRYWFESFFNDVASNIQSQVVFVQGHILQFQIQRDAYLHMRDNLVAGVLFITGDFGVHQVQSSGDGACELPDLVLVLHFLDMKGKLVHCYLDCLPLLDRHESKDWSYVTSAFNELHASGFFKGFYKIQWWSDTGPAHFRTSNTLWFWRSFQERTGIVIEVNFFAPYHGHIGAISRAVTFAGNQLNGKLAVWNRCWVEGQIASLGMTTLVQVPIERNAKVVRTVVGIRKFLCFSFDHNQPNTVSCMQVCNDVAVTEVKTFVQLEEHDLAENVNSEHGEHNRLSALVGLPAVSQIQQFV